MKDEFLKGISLFIVIGANTGSVQLQTKNKITRLKKINQTGVRERRDLEEEVRIAEICVSWQSIGTECKTKSGLLTMITLQRD